MNMGKASPLLKMRSLPPPSLLDQGHLQTAKSAFSTSKVKIYGQGSMSVIQVPAQDVEFA